METSLHRQLKSHYAEANGSTEVTLGKYRIDVVRGQELIEIQHGSLATIRDKVRALLKQHQVRVVKPIIARKHLVKRKAKGKAVYERRLSPKRGTILDLFYEMVYFCRVFPHENLMLEVPLVTVEEWRFPGHGRRRWRHRKDHQVEDQKLVDVEQVHEFRTAADLNRMLPEGLPCPFSTQHIAAGLQVDRSFARLVAYSLRETGAIKQVAKQGNSLLYQRAA
jgi:hypothetical protein